MPANLALAPTATIWNIGLVLFGAQPFGMGSPIKIYRPGIRAYQLSRIQCCDYSAGCRYCLATYIVLRTMNSFSPTEIPAQHVCLCLTDNSNSMAWGNKVTLKLLQGQNLIGIYAEILRHSNIGMNSEHLARILNTRADDISRPFSPNLSLVDVCHKIFLKQQCLRTWDYFLPNPELLQLPSSALFIKPSPVPPKVPKDLGWFVPVEFTIFSSPQIGSGWMIS
jgi:hypothetical protein